MEAADFFRARIDAMLNLSDPLAVLARRLAWDQIEAAVAAKFERQNRAGQILEGQDLFGPTQVLEGAGRSNAGRPKLSIRLMASLLYLKHSFNLREAEMVNTRCMRPRSSASARARRASPTNSASRAPWSSHTSTP